MAKNGKNQPRHVVAANDKTEKALSEMSTSMHGHLIDTALRAGHGHVVGSVGGNDAPRNDHVLQQGGFLPQKIFAGPSQVSGGSFESGASNADYSTTSVGDTPDADSGTPGGL